MVEAAIEQGGFEEPARVVLEHMTGVEGRRSGVAHRIERVLRALREPWSPPALARELRDLLAAPLQTRSEPEFGKLLSAAGDFVDLELPLDDEGGHLKELDLLFEQLLDEELEGGELLELLSSFLAEAHDAMTRLQASWSAEDLTTIFETHGKFREAWYRNHFPTGGISAEASATLETWTGLLRRVEYDRALALAIAQRVTRLGEAEFRGTLMKRLRRYRSEGEHAGFDGDVRAIVGESDFNRVVLGGTQSTTYAGHAALVIDLGGDDVYERAAVVDSPDSLVSVVLDLAGDDRYNGTPGAATATGGLALLVDVKGDDHHQSGRLAQAAATFGVALLVDLEGDDRYEMEDYGQGHAVAGTAILYDVEGDDDYRAWAFAQGGGLTYGFSALVDGAGDDNYLADLAWPDVYGNSGPDIYHGASQGYATGIRSGGGVAGGVAALVDLGDGMDRYQSGNFSQGGGYYFSFGLLYDDGGDDENFGTRYSQGFGVHQAAGVRWDRAGDDRYTCRSVAHSGMAWDEGVGYFLEDEGDDVYQFGALALGGAAQTGVAVCIDSAGADQYKSGGQAQGGTGSFEYHDKPSIAVLIDLGGQADSYSMKGRGDNTTLCSESVGVFVDVKAKSMDKALRELK